MADTLTARLVGRAAPAPTGRQAAAVELRNHHLLRAAISAAWVGAAFTAGSASPLAAGLLLVLYPAWDAAANALDAHANGGLRANPSQALNLAVSSLVALAVAGALAAGPDIAGRLTLGLFGGWAVLAGLLQSATAVRRWRAYGGQWPTALSGAQSALAGGFFILGAAGPRPPVVITAVAPYAAFGAAYFLISAVALTWRSRRAAHPRVRKVTE